MRIADIPAVYSAIHATRRPHLRVERPASVRVLPRHRRTGEDHASYAGRPDANRALPPRGWLVDIYV